MMPAGRARCLRATSLFTEVRGRGQPVEKPVRPTPADPNNDVLFSVEAPEPLSPLPAATEVVSYRIVQEAMVNVARHAKASFCRVSLSIDDRRNELQLEIADDGAGIPKDRRAGVGMSSMHEGVEDLGGTRKAKYGVVPTCEATLEGSRDPGPALAI
jgi:Histidine kinase-, DNA gyrase B-, and HSP90-like ATPase